MWMWTRTLRAGVVVMLVVALLAGPAAARDIVPTSWAELIRGLIPSVVNITVRIAGTAAPEEALVSAGQSASPYRIAVGSGFVIDSSGLIATNWHVVADAFEIIVTFLRRQSYSRPGRRRLAGGRSCPSESGCGPPVASGPLGR
jgi:S1-C subfamily serine protease